jgi:hypothetical protein
MERQVLRERAGGAAGGNRAALRHDNSSLRVREPSYDLVTVVDAIGKRATGSLGHIDFRKPAVFQNETMFQADAVLIGSNDNSGCVDVVAIAGKKTLFPVESLDCPEE